MVLGAAIALAGIGATWWILGRPDADVVAQDSQSEPDHPAGPVDCNAAPYGNRITRAVPSDVEVITHGTVCRIRGTVQGTVTVRDETPSCDENDAITAIDVVGGTVEATSSPSGACA